MVIRQITRIPLRFALPLLLVLLALTAGALSYLYTDRVSVEQAVTTETESLTRLMSRLQDSLEYALRRGSTERVIEEVAALGAEPSITHALLVDPSGNVIASLRRADLGLPLAAVLATDPVPVGDLLGRVVRAAAGGVGGQVVPIEHSNALVASYPIRVTGPRGGELRPADRGVLVVRVDLVPHILESRRSIRMQALQFGGLTSVLALVFLVLAHFTVTRRVDRLLAAAREFAGGDMDSRASLRGGDEIASIGKAFDDMARQVASTQQLLSEREAGLNRAQRVAHMGSWELMVVSGVTRWSDETFHILGLDPQSGAASLEGVIQATHPEERQRLRTAIEAARSEAQPIAFDHRILLPDGRLRHVHHQIELYDEGGRHEARVVGTLQDITERKDMEQALFETKERALVTLHSIGDAVITTDASGLVDYLNPVAEVLTGWTTDEAHGRPLPDIFQIVNENTQEPMTDPVARCLREERVVGLASHTIMINRAGHHIPIEDSAAPIRDNDGKVLGVIMVFHDVSKTREMAQQLSWQASHDALTGLVNRREFENRLRKALDRVARDKHPHALLYVDLDQFKVVNDTCGHVAGDELLRQVSMLLRDRIRESDTLARLGGDEFGVLLTACPQRIAEDIARKLLGTVKEFRFVWQDRTFEIGASIGLVMVADPEESMDSVMSAADMACYAAKDLGRNRVHIYHADDADLTQRHDEMQLVSRITNALDEGRFALYRQKIVPLGERDTEAQHYEILLRMVDEDGELVPPGAFMPAAERYNLMPTLDRWVIRTFFSEFRDELRRLTSDCRTSTPGPSCFYAINLSGASLADDNFLEFIEAELAAQGIPPNVIAFEVTETVAIANLARAVTFMRELRARGCLFALDDFGSGVSSFAYLKNLPVQFLKIDGSFVKDMTDDPIDRAMVSSINEIGHVMGMRTIAEFVEDAETFRELERLGVDFAQGFGIERPQPLYEPPSVAARTRVANADPDSEDEQQPGPQDDTVEYERPHPDTVQQLEK